MATGKKQSFKPNLPPPPGAGEEGRLREDAALQQGSVPAATSSTNVPDWIATAITPQAAADFEPPTVAGDSEMVAVGSVIPDWLLDAVKVQPLPSRASNGPLPFDKSRTATSAEGQAATTNNVPLTVPQASGTRLAVVTSQPATDIVADNLAAPSATEATTATGHAATAGEGQPQPAPTPTVAAAITDQPATKPSHEASVATSGQQPTTDQQLTTDQPTTDQPTTDQPTTDQPTTDQPTIDQPTIDQPTTRPSAAAVLGAGTAAVAAPSDEAASAAAAPASVGSSAVAKPNPTATFLPVTAANTDVPPTALPSVAVSPSQPNFDLASALAASEQEWRVHDHAARAAAQKAERLRQVASLQQTLNHLTSEDSDLARQDEKLVVEEAQLTQALAVLGRTGVNPDDLRERVVVNLTLGEALQRGWLHLPPEAQPDLPVQQSVPASGPNHQPSQPTTIHLQPAGNYSGAATIVSQQPPRWGLFQRVGALAQVVIAAGIFAAVMFAAFLFIDLQRDQTASSQQVTDRVISTAISTRISTPTGQRSATVTSKLAEAVSTTAPTKAAPTIEPATSTALVVVLPSETPASTETMPPAPPTATEIQPTPSEVAQAAPLATATKPQQPRTTSVGFQGAARPSATIAPAAPAAATRIASNASVLPTPTSNVPAGYVAVAVSRREVKQLQVASVGIDTAVVRVATINNGADWDVDATRGGLQTPEVGCGEPGMIVVNGHNWGRGRGVFAKLGAAPAGKALGDGDHIICTGKDGTTATYRVYDAYLYAIKDNSFAHLAPGETANLTLYTCNDSGSKRVVYFARLES